MKTFQTSRPVELVVCQNILVLKKFACPHISMCVTLNSSQGLCYAGLITNCFRRLTFKIFTSPSDFSIFEIH